jgi:integrase
VLNISRINELPSFSGSVCNVPQFQIADVCVSSTRPQGLGSRCIVSELGQFASLCFSTDSHPIKGTVEAAITSVRTDPDSAMLAETEVVPSAAGAPGGSPQEATGITEIVEAATVVIVPQQPLDVGSSRLEIVKQSHVDRGFSTEVAERMAAAQKPSSLKVYDSKWRNFCDWCVGRQSDPLHSSAAVVADFLLHLKTEKKLAVSTIEGYRTAISHTLKAVSDVDIGRDPHISSLLANFAREKTPRSSAPPWDLSLVLRKLTQPPFEPLHKAEFKHVTLKTVFLVALASGARRSEIHALTNQVLHTENWNSIHILPDPQFVPKTRLASEGTAVLQPVVIKALTKVLPSELQEDRSLCPVRAVRYYMKKADELRGTRKKLFIAYKKGFDKDREIHMNTVSSWLKKVIKLAYEGASDEDNRVLNIKAHHVRSMAASWALLNQASMEDIMGACSWKSHNTFTQFYLKDLSLIREDMHHLGPVVAASHVG